VNVRSRSARVKPLPPAFLEPRGPGVIPPNPAKQARSKKSLDLLLNATEAVLSEKGLDGATVPAIARRAGVSVGVVYQRFPDKDALLRATYERVFARLRGHNRSQLANPALADFPLKSILIGAVYGAIAGHRKHKGLLKALMIYAMTHHDPAFRRRVKRINQEALGTLKTLIRNRRDEVSHPDPEMAGAFGLLVVTLAVRSLILFDEGAATDFAPPPERLADELVRMYECYLGVKPFRTK
jgi:AcrR family transcriptional regulator